MQTRAARRSAPLRRRCTSVVAAAAKGDSEGSAAAAATTTTTTTTAAPAVSPFGAAPAAAPKPPPAPSGPSPPRPWATHTWAWRGHRINYATAGCGAPVLLVHGFGASLGHYRRTIPALAAAGHKVYAIDLLGFGASDKPLLKEEGGYTIELWADLVADFAREFCGANGGGESVAPAPACEGAGSSSGSNGSNGSSGDGGSGSGSGGNGRRGGVVLVGNSIGSLVCLAAAAALPADGVAGVCLLNSAGAM